MSFEWEIGPRRDVCVGNQRRIIAAPGNRRAKTLKFARGGPCVYSRSQGILGDLAMMQQQERASKNKDTYIKRFEECLEKYL